MGVLRSSTSQESFPLPALGKLAMISPPVLVTLASLLSLCSALGSEHAQLGSPIRPGFTQGESFLSLGGALKIGDVPSGFGSFSKAEKRDLLRRACGTTTLGPCPNDQTVCCPIGGQCCAGGRCCAVGTVCQTNYLGNIVCCAQGSNCYNFVPDVCIHPFILN